MPDGRTCTVTSARMSRDQPFAALSDAMTTSAAKHARKQSTPMT